MSVVHTSLESQSALVLHSTHTPSVALHTRSGHMREEVQVVAGVHIPAMHVVPSAQSAARTHVDSVTVPQPENASATDAPTAIQPVLLIC